MAIEKLNLQEFLRENKGYKIFKREEDTTIILLPSGKLLKILDNNLLEHIDDTGYSLEKRLEEANNFTSFSRFSIPTRMFEDNGIVNSYTMPKFPGIDFTDYYENIFDLMSYAKIHSQIESNIKDGNNLGIVFPDLCTTENIIVTEYGQVYFIDYDGLQIRDMPAIGYSTFLGNKKEVLTPKYYDPNTGLFTKEIDIKSAIFLYFVDVFGINLSFVNRINPYTGKRVTLDFVFSTINLQDPVLNKKFGNYFKKTKRMNFWAKTYISLLQNTN